jgi:hypothetical protein
VLKTPLIEAFFTLFPMLLLKMSTYGGCPLGLLLWDDGHIPHGASNMLTNSIILLLFDLSTRVSYLRASLYCFPRIFYCNLLEEIVDLNKLFSTFSKKFVEEVRDDYSMMIPWIE